MEKTAGQNAAPQIGLEFVQHKPRQAPTLVGGILHERGQFLGYGLVQKRVFRLSAPLDGRRYPQRGAGAERCHGPLLAKRGPSRDPIAAT